MPLVSFRVVLDHAAGNDCGVAAFNADTDCCMAITNAKLDIALGALA
jgi:hypothetical protein